MYICIYSLVLHDHNVVHIVQIYFNIYSVHVGRFRSSQVIEALRDLLYNSEANVRAVAAVSLAKTGASDSMTVKCLMKCLNDKDRLVREAGCLALGHLKAKQAVPKILHIW